MKPKIVEKALDVPKDCVFPTLNKRDHSVRPIAAGVPIKTLGMKIRKKE